MEDRATISAPGLSATEARRRIRSPLHWLRNVPVADPVDRRNAPMLQMIALLLATLPPLAWLARAVMAGSIPWRPGEFTSMLFSLLVSAAAAVSVVLVRQGKFAKASHLLLLVFGATVVPAYLSTGFGAQRFEQPVLVIWMAIAGLVVGRAALWIMFLCIAAAFAFGIAADIRKTGDAAALVVDAASSAAMFLMIAIVLDRSASALRESLWDAKEHGDALADANVRLAREAADREHAHAQLIQAQKTEAVGRMASGVAHDFGNIVSVIGGHARRGISSSDAAEMKDALVGVANAVNRAAALTRRLLSFSQPGAGTEEWFDPKEALANLWPMIRQLMDPRIRIDSDIDETLPAIYFDRTQFDLMVLNIAANADHAMPQGGVFSLSARRGEGNHLRMELADTGTGMDQETMARIFEPFFTTKPRGHGTGLGLSVVREIVERAGGSITARSEEGKGTTIVVRIPVAPE